MTQFATSPDGARIAYDVTGGGPALILLHGMSKNRAGWHEIGYVDRLQDDFTVITIDKRGSGESERFTRAEDYAIEKLCADVYAVADACGAERFGVWGFSLGGNTARYLGKWSGRVRCIVFGGAAFGAALSDETRQWALDEEARWTPIVARYNATGEIPPLPDDERAELVSGHVATSMALLRAMMSWPSVQPGDVRCPAMIAVGSRNRITMQRLAAQRAELDAAGIAVHVLDGLDHGGEFTEIERVMGIVYPFLHHTMLGHPQ